MATPCEPDQRDGGSTAGKVGTKVPGHFCPNGRALLSHRAERKPAHGNRRCRLDAPESCCLLGLRPRRRGGGRPRGLLAPGPAPRAGERRGPRPHRPCGRLRGGARAGCAQRGAAGARGRFRALGGRGGDAAGVRAARHPRLRGRGRRPSRRHRVHPGGRGPLAPWRCRRGATGCRACGSRTASPSIWPRGPSCWPSTTGRGGRSSLPARPAPTAAPRTRSAPGRGHLGGGVLCHVRRRRERRGGP